MTANNGGQEKRCMKTDNNAHHIILSVKLICKYVRGKEGRTNNCTIAMCKKIQNSFRILSLTPTVEISYIVTKSVADSIHV